MGDVFDLVDLLVRCSPHGISMARSEKAMSTLRVLITVLLLAGTALLLHLRDSTETRTASEPLADFPKEVGAWKGTDRQIEADVLEILGAGDFLSRIYTQGDVAPISLFIGYFPTQRTGTTIHSPKNCLPGNGWTFESSRTVMLGDGRSMSHRIGEYVITSGEDRQFVIYWYQAHGRSVANEYMAKMFLVSDAIWLNRTDGGLVRVITPIRSNGDVSEAKMQAEAFVKQIFPALPRFIPD
jgi:EpsI family protein